MPKIYLSPAAHAQDHACSAVNGCSENTHCNAYLDALIPYLDACGIAWKRADKANTGALLCKTVAESNAWKPDLHYVVHTNAANGQAMGSRPMVWPTGKGYDWAAIILKHRAAVYPYPMRVNTRTDLYELNSTAAVCIYEELVFHDNQEDAAWLHAHMRELAAHTAMAFCEIFGLKFVDPHAGDVNGDGTVDSSDARTALQAAVGKVTLTDEQMQSADLNGDGEVNSSDAREILRRAVDKQ